MCELLLILLQSVNILFVLHIMSSPVSTEVMFVWRLFAVEKLTVAWANLLHDKVVQQSGAILSLVIHGP